MSEAKRREEWSHTSQLLALIANAHRDPKKQRPYTPCDFNPFKAEKKPLKKTKDLSILKTIFVDPHKRKVSHDRPHH